MAEERQLTPMESLVLQVQPAFERIATESNLVRWSEESVFAQQIIARNPKLMEVHLPTLQDAIINVASLGMTLNPAYGFCYLIAEYNKATKRTEAVLRVSFKGLIALATASNGPLTWCVADVVRENDNFTFNGKWEKPTHTMNPFGERGKPVGVYCTAKTRDGEFLTEIAPWDEVMKAKAAAKTAMVWDKWPEEMAKKFIIKRASKQWPRAAMNDHVQHAIGELNRIEGSEDLTAAKLDDVAKTIIAGIENEDDEAIYTAWQSLDENEMAGIWLAKTKGGWFTQDQKSAIRAANGRVGDAKREQAEAEAAAIDDERYTYLEGVRQAIESEDESAFRELWDELDGEHRQHVQDGLNEQEWQQATAWGLE